MDVNTQIKQMLTAPSPLRRYCEVVEVIAEGMYLVKDRGGVHFEAGSTSVWREGEQVVVENGRIVRKGGQIKVHKVVEI